MAKELTLLSGSYVEQKATAGADLTAGDVVLGTNVNGFVGFADVLSGASYAKIVKAEKVGGDKAAVAVDTDDPAYWDDTAKNLTNVETANTLIGVFAEPGASGDATGVVIFDGTLAFAKA